MGDGRADNPDRRAAGKVTDLLVRGVFAFTPAIAAAGQRREKLLRSQDPRLN